MDMGEVVAQHGGLAPRLGLESLYETVIMTTEYYPKNTCFIRVWWHYCAKDNTAVGPALVAPITQPNANSRK